LGALASGLGGGTAGLIIDGLKPKPRPTGGLSPTDLQAIRDLTEALNRIAQNRSPSSDELWQVGDAMQAFANRQPDYLGQAMETIRKNSPPYYDFAKQLQQTVQPAFQQSAYARLLLDKVGPAPTQPSSAQPFVLPQIKQQPFPAQIKDVPWPKTTPFVWPKLAPPTQPSAFTFPTQPSAFTFPGQPGGETEGQRALREAQETINKRAQEFFARQ
jgi:hypothetical protein